MTDFALSEDTNEAWRTGRVLEGRAVGGIWGVEGSGVELLVAKKQLLRGVLWPHGEVDLYRLRGQ